MENNIEDLIRDDFRKREIQPNTNAFERLHAKLDTRTASKRKKGFRMLGYAAGLIGFIFILQYVVKTNRTNTEEIITNVKIQETIEIPTDNESTSIAIEQLEDANPTKLPTIEPSNNKVIIKEEIVSNLKKETPSKILETTISKKESVPIQLIAKENIAFNDTSKKHLKPTEITDKELDALLIAANQSLSKEGGDSITINARSMLYELEVEINKPLPEKVLLTLKTGVVTIKELVKSNDKENN